MGESSWTIRTKAVVRADLPRVLEWWLHPDRLADARALYERRGAAEVLVETMDSDGRRIREWTVRFRSGTEVKYMVETELGPDGPGVPGDDRHVIRTWDHQRVDYTTGRRVTIECENVTEFISAPSGTTEIISVHSHRKSGGKWFERFLPPNSERALLNRELRAMATQCEMDLSNPPSASPD